MTTAFKIIVWYDRRIRLWTAVIQDDQGNQIGDAGHDISREGALADVRYQNKEILNGTI